METSVGLLCKARMKHLVPQMQGTSGHLISEEGLCSV